VTLWFEKMKRILKNIVVLSFVIGIFISKISFAQNLTVSAKLDSAKVLIGDHIALKLEVSNPNHFNTLFPDANFDTTSKFEIVNVSKIDTTTTGYNRTFIYTIFDSGKYEIPALKFLIQHNNKTDTLFSNPLSINVAGIPVDTMKAFRPIKKMMDIEMTFREMLPYIIVGGIVFLLIAVLIVYLIFFRKKKEIIVQAAPAVHLTPYQKAMLAFDNLEKENLIADDKVKLYYTKLTDILRNYLEEQYKVAALESTTDELMERIKFSAIDAASKLQLHEILSSADMVKFAKAKPGLNEHAAAMLAAKGFVERTKPMETNPSEESSDSPTKK
jgi:uncharacterized membrane protein